MCHEVNCVKTKRSALLEIDEARHFKCLLTIELEEKRHFDQ